MSILSRGLRPLALVPRACRGLPRHLPSFAREEDEPGFAREENFQFLLDEFLLDAFGVGPFLLDLPLEVFGGVEGVRVGGLAVVAAAARVIVLLVEQILRPRTEIFDGARRATRARRCGGRAW